MLDNNSPLNAGWVLSESGGMPISSHVSPYDISFPCFIRS